MKRRLSIIAVAASGVLFFVAVYYLLHFRYRTGDAYPQYSSLRPDPLGTMVFYEALEQLPGMTVRRDFAAVNRLPETSATTYMHLAARPRSWARLDEELDTELTRFVISGGRIVILLYPQTSKPWDVVVPPKVRGANEEDKEVAKSSRRWAFETAYFRLPSQDGFAPITVTNSGAVPSLPQELEWRSGLVLAGLSAEWTPVFVRGTNPVVAERRLGRGSMVVGTDSFLTSNESLRSASEPAFLAWLVGSSREVVFDEAHLGTVEQAGVAVLMRRYHLEGLVMGLLTTALLFVWKQSSRFVSAAEPAEAVDHVQGRGTSAGLVNLLRRNIKASDLGELCLLQWHQVFGRTRGSAVKLSAAEMILQEEKNRQRLARDAVRLYNELRTILKPPGAS